MTNASTPGGATGVPAGATEDPTRSASGTAAGTTDRPDGPLSSRPDAQLESESATESAPSLATDEGQTDAQVGSTSAERTEESTKPAAGKARAEDFDWRQVLPWEGKPTFLDKALLWSIFGLFVFFIVMLPLRPFFLASHPVMLQLMTGSKAATGAAAAFARIGEIPLWVAVVAGVVGMVKFDFLFWWTGRQWGHKIVDMFAPSPRAKQIAARAQDLNPWLVRIAVTLSYLPGIPTALVFAIAGWTRMSLATFLFFNTLGAGIVTGIVVWLGYSLGQNAVDVVLAIDNYALWISLGLIVAIAMWPGIKGIIAANREEKQKLREKEAANARNATEN